MTLYVMLVRHDGVQLATKGPFEESDTDGVYKAMEHMEWVYNPGHVPDTDHETSTLVLRVVHSVRHPMKES